MKKFYLILLFLIYVLPSNAAPAMYSVDYKLCIALHPLMGNYDIVLGRHLRNDVNFDDFATEKAVDAKIHELSIKAEEKSSQIRSQLYKMETELATLENKADPNNTSYTKKINSLRDQIASLEAQNQQIWDDTLNPRYYTREQSNQIVANVLKEIDSIIQSLSLKLGGAIIIDSDYQAIQPITKRITDIRSAGSSPLAIKIYQSVLNAAPRIDIEKAFEHSPDLAMYRASYNRFYDEDLDKNIIAQISRSPLFRSTPGISGRLVLVGSKDFDLTTQVVEKILQKYRIKQDTINRILAQIK